MLQKLIYRLTHRHHYWRDISFDELGELYTIMTFRSLAFSIVGIFIPVYLYQLDFTITSILFFYALIYFALQVTSLLSAWVIARYGPKHTMFVSQLMFVLALSLLTTLDQYSWPITLIALILGASNGAYFTAFHVDFSKVQHRKHGGKELGWLFSLQKIGIALGPMVGGVVGYLFGAQYIFMVATLLLAVGTVPLFFTKEPTRLNQHISFKNLSLRKIWRDIFSYSSMCVENMVSMVIWPFFIAVYILSENPYFELGAVVSISVIVTFFAARTIGKLIDEKRGRNLLRVGVTLNAILHLARPFAPNFSGALFINLINEVLTPMYRMPISKGTYDAASDLPGRRIVYLATQESVSGFARGVFFSIVAVATYAYDTKGVMISCFVVGAFISLLIMVEKFRALNG